MAFSMLDLRCPEQAEPPQRRSRLFGHSSLPPSCFAGLEKKVKASLLSADVHMNVRHLPNKYLPKGGLISIPRFALPALPLTAAALQQLLFGALTSPCGHVAGPFPNAPTPEAEDSEIFCSGFVTGGGTHVVRAVGSNHTRIPVSPVLPYAMTRCSGDAGSLLPQLSGCRE